MTVEQAAPVRSAPTQSLGRALQKGRRNTQRERILAGMTEMVARDGYAATTIAQVIAHAGVSRPTFYEYFTDKSDCFVAALRTIQDRLKSEVDRALDHNAPARAVHAVLATLVEFAHSRPAMARVLLDEALRGGPRALDVRDQGIRALEELIEERYRAVNSAAAPDLPARTLIGGIYRLIASQLRSGRPHTAELLEELGVWIDYYVQPLEDHRWRALHPLALRTPSAVIESPLQSPHPLGPGHARLSKREVAENHRQRILLAAAGLAEQKGYPAITITDISKRAGIDNRVFYRFFADKQDAFRALHELLFRHIMAVTVAGFLAGDTWPKRIWEGGRAFAQYMEQNLMLAYASFVDSHAADADIVARVEQFVSGFAIFLQEGYQCKPQHHPPSSLTLHAITTTVFELNYAQVRECRVGQLSGLLPHVTFISLAPFIGAAEANAFIDRELERHPGSSRSSSSSPPTVARQTRSQRKTGAAEQR